MLKDVDFMNRKRPLLLSAAEKASLLARLADDANFLASLQANHCPCRCRQTISPLQSHLSSANGQAFGASLSSLETDGLDPSRSYNWLSTPLLSATAGGCCR